jgi:uncharacterized membrane protein
MEDSKNITQSKVFWLNILGPLFLWLNHKYGVVIDSDTELDIAILVMGAANAILRRFTSTPVTILPTEK